MRTLHVTDIDWDTDGGEVAGLPTAITMIVDDDFDAENEIADCLSDRYDLCVFGCSYTE